MASSSVAALERVKKAWQAGTASVSDYVNALRAAKDAVEKATGPDLLQKQIDAGQEFDNKMKAINKDTEGWQKQAGAATDEYIKKMEEINKLAKPTIADVPKAEDELDRKSVV